MRRNSSGTLPKTKEVWTRLVCAPAMLPNKGGKILRCLPPISGLLSQARVRPIGRQHGAWYQPWAPVTRVVSKALHALKHAHTHYATQPKKLTDYGYRICALTYSTGTQSRPVEPRQAQRATPAALRHRVITLLRMPRPPEQPTQPMM